MDGVSGRGSRYTTPCSASISCVTGWIGEWLLLVVGAALHAVTVAVLWNIGLRPAARWGLEKQRA